MPVPQPEFTVGIEEEYLLVDRATRDLVRDPPGDMLDEMEDQLRVGQVGPEFLRSQVEVATATRSSLADARADLARLRLGVSEVATTHGLAIIASSTHPFAAWRDQRHTDNERYNQLALDMQMVARRLVICGMHVHVGIGDDDLRIDLMNQVTYFLPHLLALSTSSPFWHGFDTGLKSYRMSIFKAVPRTGLPEQFNSWAEYQRHLDVLVKAGLIGDATKLWWDIRPSARYPTLELRIADVCTRLDDGITIAALYLCILRMLWRQRLANQRWRAYAHMLIQENVWRAQRYGVTGSLMDFGRAELVPLSDLLEELLVLVAEDAEFFGCQAELDHARAIVGGGTSADLQVAAFEKARENGASDDEAIKAVVDVLVAETVAGL